MFVDTSRGGVLFEGGGNFNLDSKTTITNDLHVTGDLRVDGNAILNGGVDGTITIGDDDDTIDLNASISSSLIPDEHEAYDIGQWNNRWNRIYTRSISSGDATLADITADSLNLLDGIQASDITVTGYVSAGGDITASGG